MMGALLMAVLYVGLVYMSNEYGRAATSGPSALAVPQGLPEVPPANGLAASGLAELRARAGHDVPALRPEPTMASVRADADTTSTPARTMSGMPRGAGQPSAPDKATQPLASRGGDPARSSPSAPAAVMPVATVQSYAPPLQPPARSEPMLTPALSIRSGTASATAGTTTPTSPAMQERQVASMPAADAEPVRAASSHALSGADLERLLDRYIYFYERGDINGFMSLFDDAARTESGGKMKIRQEYERFFQATQYRRLELTIPPVAEGVDAYVGKVPFRATVKRQSESQVGVFTGALYFEVEKRQGRAMITTLFFTLG